MAKGRFPPLSHQPLRRVRIQRITIKTVVGEVAIEAAYGQDRRTQEWLSPIRELWGLGPHAAMSPALEEKVCYTAAMTFSYEHAAAVAAKWGSPVDDAAIHRHVQVKGMEALALEDERVERALSVEQRAEVVAEAKRHLPRGEFSLVIMMDGTPGCCASGGRTGG